MISTKIPLELLHMDLFGPSRIASINKNRYVFVIIDDYFRYTWVIFLKHKNVEYHEFTVFCKRVQNQKSTTIITIRSDHGGEFENELFKTFCEENGITHNFSFPRASPQNGVVERKNRTLQETARTMLIDSKLPKYFWAEAVNTSCYILNRVLIRPFTHKTCYELYHDKFPKVSYFKTFGCKYYILNTKGNLNKFDSRSDEGIFLGYSTRSKAYRIFNKNTSSIEESLHVRFDEQLSKPIVRETIEEPINVIKKDLIEEPINVETKKNEEILEEINEEDGINIEQNTNPPIELV